MLIVVCYLVRLVAIHWSRRGNDNTVSVCRLPGSRQHARSHETPRGCLPCAARWVSSVLYILCLRNTFCWTVELTVTGERILMLERWHKGSNAVCLGSPLVHSLAGVSALSCVHTVGLETGSASGLWQPVPLVQKILFQYHGGRKEKPANPISPGKLSELIMVLLVKLRCLQRKR